MATYTDISEVEMREFLTSQGFVQIAVPGTVELVFAKRVPHTDFALSLRVYSTIAHGGGRAVGEDAIRCQLFYRDATGKITRVGTSKRVHRVSGWRENLLDRINNWMDYAPIKCPDCGKPMVPRKSKFGMFYGCIGYPLCKSTYPI